MSTEQGISESLTIKVIRWHELNESCETNSISELGIQFITHEKFSIYHPMSPNRLNFESDLGQPCTLNIRFQGVNGYVEL